MRTEVIYKVTLTSLPPLSATKLLKRVEKLDQMRRDFREEKKRFKEDVKQKKAQIDELAQKLQSERAAFEKEKSKAK